MKLEWENDDDGWRGQVCAQWLIRDVESDNRDIVAVVPKTDDGEYDDRVTYPLVRDLVNRYNQHPELLNVLESVSRYLYSVQKYVHDWDALSFIQEAEKLVQTAVAKAKGETA